MFAADVEVSPAPGALWGTRQRTFDVSVQLALCVKVLQPFEEFSHNNRNVLFTEDAGLHLRDNHTSPLCL